MSASPIPTTQPQMMLMAILRQICQEMELPFGHGMRAYANLQTRRGIYENEKKFPRLYLYPVNITTEQKFGAITNTYDCYLDILAQCSLKASQDEIESVMYNTHLLSGTFLKKLLSHPSVTAMTSIVREPNYHLFDENLCGWVIRFEINILEEQPLC